MTDVDKYYSISFLGDKYGISERRIHNIVNWIKNSHGVGIDLKEGCGHYSVYNGCNSQYSTFNFLYNKRGIEVIEDCISKYAAAHPKLRINIHWPSIDNFPIQP